MNEQPSPMPDVTTPEPVSPSATGHRRTVAIAGASALLAAGAVLAVQYATNRDDVVAGSGSAVLPAADQQNPALGSGDGNAPSGADPNASGSTNGVTTSATAAQQAGVVDINTVLKYQNARAAGTGMVVTSSGEVLTNNHVIEGATSISVTVVSTGKTYTATVVGTDPTDDVAVLQLQNASGLQTASFGDASSAQVGDAVTGVGNAGGTGGTPTAATGTIVALNQSITASDDNGQNAEQLSGLIEINAQIEAGDSGGPLYDKSGHIIGMDTAASTNGRVTNAAYAIPINQALRIAAEIEAGQESATIHIGNPGFLGVSAADTADLGVEITAVVPGSPAASAGIQAGDVITKVGSTSVSSATALHDALAGYDPGQSITITWTDSTGQIHHASVTLASGPAD